MYRYSSRFHCKTCILSVFNCTGRLLTACTQRDFWDPSILISVNRILGRIKSSRFIRTKVDFHGNPTSTLYFLHEKFIWNLVLSRSSQCFGSASEPMKLQETIYPVLVVARTVKKTLQLMCQKIYN